MPEEGNVDISDIFGKGAPGGRPEHPDFWKLSDILLKFDSDLDPSNPDEAAKEAQWQARMKEVGIDLDSLSYAATQRAYRICGIRTVVDLLDPEKVMEVARVASVWMEGVAAGVTFERSKS